MKPIRCMHFYFRRRCCKILASIESTRRQVLSFEIDDAGDQRDFARICDCSKRAADKGRSRNSFSTNQLDTTLSPMNNGETFHGVVYLVGVNWKWSKGHGLDLNLLRLPRPQEREDPSEYTYEHNYPRVHLQVHKGMNDDDVRWTMCTIVYSKG